MANTLFDSLSLLEKCNSSNDFKDIVYTAFKQKDCICMQRQTIDGIRLALNHDNDNDVEKLFRALTTLINRCLVSKESTYGVLNAVFPEGHYESVKKLLLETIQELIDSYKQTSIYSMPLLNSFSVKVAIGSEPHCSLVCNLKRDSESEVEPQIVGLTIQRQHLSQIIEAMSKIRRQLFNAAESR